MQKGGGLDVAKLTPKQIAFADEYIINGGNATQAAIKAGYSKKTAYQTGAENLRKPHIQEYISNKTEPIDKKRSISADDALDRLISIWQGTVITSHSKQIDHLDNNAIIKDMTYEFTPDLDSTIKALDLYLKYKSLLSQAQIQKAEIEIELMRAKLEKIRNAAEQTTEDKLDELLSAIKEEIHDY